MEVLKSLRAKRRAITRIDYFYIEDIAKGNTIHVTSRHSDGTRCTPAYDILKRPSQSSRLFSTRAEHITM
uniref:WYL domain-containing protein n=1 Tax=Trichogramma kaykai TaxID=54128 RepID=A0ABD2X0Z5_9HYME